MTVQDKANQMLKKKASVPSRKQDNSLAGLVKRMQPQIEMAVQGTPLQPERFTRVMLSTLSSTPKLANCTPDSFLGAMMQSAQLGLEPNTPLGQAYLIPYGNKCQFILGYKGLIDLAYRSGQIKKIDAQPVYENDLFEYELGWDAKLKHIPAMSNRGNVIGYYALFKLADGGGNFLFMSKEDIEAHAKKFSKSYTSGPWKSDFNSMALKTVIRQLLKYAPLNVDKFTRALAADETIKEVSVDDISNVDVLDVQPQYEINDEPIEAEVVQVNSETGEVLSPVEELQEQL